MSIVPWTQEINFASALLLHSCITVILKELSNGVTIFYRLTFHKAKHEPSVVLDGYTSIFSKDEDGELAELYFTNTGFVLLMLSLASAIAMNLTLPIRALNVLIAVTFGLTFVASALVACRHRSLVMPIMALRRAGRFIWSDTPFVNFFSLIYIAVALKGSSNLALRDYVIFRSIAIVELLFMKARLAASDPETQQTMLKRLLDSEYIMRGKTGSSADLSGPPQLEHDCIVPFTSVQRLFVMFFKTAVGYDDGSICGSFGLTTITVPSTEGFFIDEAEQYGWRIYRVSPNFFVLEDCGQVMVTKNLDRKSTKERRGLSAKYTKFISWTHGVLLRRLGRRRVVWLMRIDRYGGSRCSWKGHSNLVTGVKDDWLKDRGRFQCVSKSGDIETTEEIVR